MLRTFVIVFPLYDVRQLRSDNLEFTLHTHLSVRIAVKKLKIDHHKLINSRNRCTAIDLPDKLDKNNMRIIFYSRVLKPYLHSISIFNGISGYDLGFFVEGENCLWKMSCLKQAYWLQSNKFAGSVSACLTQRQDCAETAADVMLVRCRQ